MDSGSTDVSGVIFSIGDSEVSAGDEGTTITDSEIGSDGAD